MIQTQTGVRQLQTFGSDYVRKSLYQKQEVSVNYSKHYIMVGRKDSGGVFYLNLREPNRVAFIGKNGSGKTWLIRAIESRMKSTGKLCTFVPSDVKDEFYSNSMPLQSKFQKLLLPNEKPVAEKIIVLRPTYFRQVSTQLKPNTNNVWYSPDLTKIRKSDFLAMFNNELLSETQKAVTERLWTEFSYKIKHDPDNFSFTLFSQWIDTFDDLKPATRDSMKRELRPIFDSQFYDPKCRKSLVDLANEGYTISVNMENYDHFTEGKFKLNEALIRIMLSELIDARRKKEINRLIIFLEEAFRFFPGIVPLVQESYDVDRRYGVDWFSVFQSFSQMTKPMVDQTRFYFVPGNIDMDTFKQLFMGLNMHSSVQAATNEASRALRRIQRVKHGWGVFDKDEHNMTVVTPAAPLTHHAEAEN